MNHVVKHLITSGFCSEGFVIFHTILVDPFKDATNVTTVHDDDGINV